jgi:HTH-type transcriptional regulator / antitoxin HipB
MDMKQIGQLVRKERKHAGLRQDELAGAAGVGTRFIVDLEAGKATLQIEKVMRVLKTLGIGVLLTGRTGGMSG